jgi:uncharacterized membrane protein (UPF0127 family)
MTNASLRRGGARGLALAVVLAAAGCGGAEEAPRANARPLPARAAAQEDPLFPAEPTGPQHLAAVELAVGGRTVRAEVARTETERQCGLMFRRDLGESDGMLFVFPEAEFRTFWMHNTPLPLSIAYVAADGRITQISDMAPMSDETTPSREAVPFALEMRQGWFRAAGVREGDRVDGLARAGAAR